MAPKHRGSNGWSPTCRFRMLGCAQNGGCTIGMLCILIKQPNVLRKICSHGNIAHYLFLDDAKAVDLGRIGLQCGRRNDALKLFLNWRER